MDEARGKLMEVAAEADDKLIEKFLGGEQLRDDEMRLGLKAGLQAGKLFPVLCGSAGQNVGVAYILKFLTDYAPSPLDGAEITAQNLATKKDEKLKSSDLGPLAAYVFKTTADPYVGKLTFFRIYSGALEAASRVNNARTGAEERLGDLYVMRGKEEIALKKLNAGDIGAVANTILVMGSERVGNRLGRFLCVVKHRGSAKSDEIAEYRVTGRGVELV